MRVSAIDMSNGYVKRKSERWLWNRFFPSAKTRFYDTRLDVSIFESFSDTSDPMFVWSNL